MLLKKIILLLSGLCILISANSFAEISHTIIDENIQFESILIETEFDNFPDLAHPSDVLFNAVPKSLTLSSTPSSSKYLQYFKERNQIRGPPTISL